MQPFDRELFRRRMNERRKQLGITYRQLQEMTGISIVTLNGYLLGRTLPNLEFAFLIAQALGVSVDWLCGMDKLKGGRKK